LRYHLLQKNRRRNAGSEGLSTEEWTAGRWVVPAVIAVVVLSLRIFLLVIPHHIGADQSHGYAPDGPWIMQDFRDTVWLPIRYLYLGGNPYETTAYLRWAPADASAFFLYTPGIMTLMAPLAALPWNLAVVVWAIIELLIVFWIGWNCVWLCDLPKRVDVVCGVVALLLAWLPTQLAFQTGNPSMVVVGAAVFVLGGKQDDWPTAAALTICLLKIQFGVPILALLLSIGRWRLVVRAIAMVILLSLPAALPAVVNSGSVSAFFDSLLTNLAAQHSSAYGNLTTPGAYRWDLAGIIGRLTGINFGMGLQMLLVCMVLIIGCWTYARALSTQRRDIALTIGSLTIILCLFHNRYDFVLCFPGAIMLAVSSIRVTQEGVSSRIAKAAAAALILGVGFHARHIDQLLRIPDDWAQGLNGLAIVAAFMICVFLVLQRSSGSVAFANQVKFHPITSE
jgi:Glycosyltransferase family 87